MFLKSFGSTEIEDSDNYLAGASRYLFLHFVSCTGVRYKLSCHDGRFDFLEQTTENGRMYEFCGVFYS